MLPRHPPRSRLTQPYPWHHPAFTPPFGSTAPPLSTGGGILGRRRALSPGMTCRLRHLSPEALAPDGLCYSVHHRLIGLIRQSGGLRVLSRTPVMDTVLDIRGSQHPVCPPHLPGLSPLNPPGLPPPVRRAIRCVHLSSSAPALAIGQSGNPWHPPIPPQVGFHAGSVFSTLHTDVRFRYGPPGCSPPCPTGPEGHRPPSPQRLLRPRFRTPGHPDTRGDMTTTPN